MSVNRLSPDERSTLVQFLLDGESASTVSRVFDVSLTTVTIWAKKSGLVYINHRWWRDSEAPRPINKRPVSMNLFRTTFVRAFGVKRLHKQLQDDRREHNASLHDVLVSMYKQETL